MAERAKMIEHFEGIIESKRMEKQMIELKEDANSVDIAGHITTILMDTMDDLIDIKD